MNENLNLVEILIINKDYHDNKIIVKSFDELRNIIEDRYKKLGPGTKQNPVDFNDIDVSNLQYFYNNEDKGIFEYTKFKYIDISEWDVSNIKSMRGMFFMCKELKSVGDISEWDVSNVTDMSGMFEYCNYFNENLSNWDVSNVKNMAFMFHACNYFNQDISGWDVSNVTDMRYMFYRCESFNQDLSNWDVLSVKNNLFMFDGCPIKDEYKPKFK